MQQTNKFYKAGMTTSGPTTSSPEIPPISPKFGMIKEDMSTMSSFGFNNHGDRENEKMRVLKTQLRLQQQQVHMQRELQKQQQEELKGLKRDLATLQKGTPHQNMKITTDQLSSPAPLLSFNEYVGLVLQNNKHFLQVTQKEEQSNAQWNRSCVSLMRKLKENEKETFLNDRTYGIRQRPAWTDITKVYEKEVCNHAKKVRQHQKKQVKTLRYLEDATNAFHNNANISPAPAKKKKHVVPVHARAANQQATRPPIPPFPPQSDVLIPISRSAPAQTTTTTNKKKQAAPQQTTKSSPRVHGYYNQSAPNTVKNNNTVVPSKAPQPAPQSDHNFGSSTKDTGVGNALITRCDWASLFPEAVAAGGSLKSAVEVGSDDDDYSSTSSSPSDGDVNSSMMMQPESQSAYDFSSIPPTIGKFNRNKTLESIKEVKSPENKKKNSFYGSLTSLPLAEEHKSANTTGGRKVKTPPQSDMGLVGSAIYQNKTTNLLNSDKNASQKKKKVAPLAPQSDMGLVSGHQNLGEKKVKTPPQSDMGLVSGHQNLGEKKVKTPPQSDMGLVSGHLNPSEQKMKTPPQSDMSLVSGQQNLRERKMKTPPQSDAVITSGMGSASMNITSASLKAQKLNAVSSRHQPKTPPQSDAQLSMLQSVNNRSLFDLPFSNYTALTKVPNESDSKGREFQSARDLPFSSFSEHHMDDKVNELGTEEDKWEEKSVAGEQEPDMEPTLFSAPNNRSVVKKRLPQQHHHNLKVPSEIESTGELQFRSAEEEVSKKKVVRLMIDGKTGENWSTPRRLTPSPFVQQQLHSTMDFHSDESDGRKSVEDMMPQDV